MVWFSLKRSEGACAVLRIDYDFGLSKYPGGYEHGRIDPNQG
jgi:hypothetical protein